MQLFKCDACGQLLYFENTKCTRCGHRLGFDPRPMRLRALEPQGGATWDVVGAALETVRFCANTAQEACNWLLPADSPEKYCEACRLNRTIPDLSISEDPGRWREIEAAKRRLIYALKRFGLPITRTEAGLSTPDDNGLAFDFLADSAGSEPVMTGHADGLITINTAEADPAERERRRVDMGEPYRTLLGHMRHEVGHYYWDMLVRDDTRAGSIGAGSGRALAVARNTFGDEREDYGEALKKHYSDGPPADWHYRFVSSYAAAHPWEDFAETWTHYLHIVDTLDTAASFRLQVDPALTDDPALSTHIAFDPYKATAIKVLVDAWLPLTYAVNSLNRSMGQPDLYPFVLTEAVIAKIGFIHDLIARAAWPERDDASFPSSQKADPR